jgi:YHS domain-containing protein
MLRFVLLLVLCVVIARAFWRVVDGIVEGLTGRPRGTVSLRPGVRMVRDPVCGTFVVPGSALSVSDRGAVRYFCSEACRDTFLGAGQRSHSKSA